MSSIERGLYSGAAPAAQTWLRTVVLRHEMPDGTWHLDWMLERDSPDERRLVTFRTREPVHESGVERFQAERIRDHRAVYLEQEGAVPGDRGVVQRLGSGRLRWLRLDGEAMSLLVDFGAGECGWVGSPASAGTGSLGGALWVFRREV
jgi:hypothetical protein